MKPRHRIALGLYDLLYLLAFTAWSPWVVWRVATKKRYREGVRDRVGFPLSRKTTGPLAWVHGVSVGEIKASIPLVRALEEEYPSLEILLSSTTPTGHGLAERIFPGKRVVYFPLDFWFMPASAQARLRPGMVLLMELELWPNFVTAARRRGCPVIVVNGRISRRSFSRYRKVRRILPQLDSIDLFCMQNQEYAERIVGLGVSPSRVKVTGNLKYDALTVKEKPEPDPEFARITGKGDGRLVLVAGSTHGEEEEILQRVVVELRRRTGKEILLVLAPRHPERGEGVLGSLRRGGIRAEKLTDFRAGRLEPPLPVGATLLVDTIGDLEKAYSVADLVFVGGSLSTRGGQNMLEPAAMAKPVLVGPNTWNFQVDVALLKEAGGLVQVGGEEELLGELARFAMDRSARESLGARARKVIQGQKGAARRTLEELEKGGWLPSGWDAPKPLSGKASIPGPPLDRGRAML